MFLKIKQGVDTMGIWFWVAVGLLCIEERRICKLQKTCDYDHLTGLRKSHGFEERVLVHIKEISGKGKRPRVSDTVSTAIVFIDVDNFKKANDTHGHNVGDKILQILADIIRNEDLVIRRSGDEFIMALFGITKEGAGLRLVDMRGQFEIAVSKEFPGLSSPVSFSFGVEEMPYSADAELLRKTIFSAETEMYKHKKERGGGR